VVAGVSYAAVFSVVVGVASCRSYAAVFSVDVGVTSCLSYATAISVVVGVASYRSYATVFSVVVGVASSLPAAYAHGCLTRLTGMTCGWASVEAAGREESTRRLRHQPKEK